MQINAYDNLLASMSAQLKKLDQTDKDTDAKGADKPAELAKGFGGLLEMALNEPDGQQAVQQARQALADGTLYNQEALEAAAENLLDFGI